MNYIAKFNPYTMEDSTILAVATGRKKLLHGVLHTLEESLRSKGIAQHMLLWGPRGMGKSFFLKYLSIQFRQTPVFENCRFVLLPEEQNNILYPSDLVRMILNHANGEDIGRLSSSWEESEESWATSYLELEQYCKEQAEKFGEFLLVAVVENIDELLRKFNNKIYESRLRSMLEKLENFVLIGASTRANLDGDYNKRIFKAFKPLKLRPWSGEDYINYFDRRYLLQTQYREDYQLTAQEQRLQKNKLKAISHYTGGSPRITVVLTDLLLDKDLITTVNTLYGLIDDLTPYYQDLISKIPAKSKLLFDTLIRLNENKSQSEVAEQLKTTQNTISRSFRWLLDNGYINGKKRKGSSSFYYYVNDRIFVLYYFRREIHHNKGFSTIWLLSDFLIDFYQEKELKQQAIRLLKDNPCREAIDLARVSMLASGLAQHQLPQLKTPEEWLKKLEEKTSVLSLSLQQYLRELNEVREADDVSVEQMVQKIEGLKEEVGQKITKEGLDELGRILSLFIVKITDYFAEEKSIQICRAMLNVKEELAQGFPDSAILVALQGWILVTNGDCLRNLEKYEEAIRYYVEMTQLNYADERDQNHLKAFGFARIGSSLRQIGCYEESLKHHQDALILYRKLGNENQQAWNLGRIGWCLSDLGRYEESLEYHQDALILYRKLGNENQQAWNLGQIGWCLSHLGRYEESLEYHQDAEVIYKKLGDKDQQASDLGQIGWCLSHLGRYEESLKYHQAAATLYKKLGDEDQQAWNLGRVGRCLSYLGRYKESLKYHQDSATLYKKLGDEDQQAWNLGRIGWCLSELERYEDSIRYHEDSISLYKELGEENQQAWGLERIGWCLSELERHEDSIKYYEDSATLYKKLEDEDEYAWVLGRIGWCLNDLERYEDAISSYRQSLALLEKSEDHNERNWQIGQLGMTKIMLDQYQEIWSFMDQDIPGKEKIYQQFWDAVTRTEKKENRPAAFQLALKLLHSLEDYKDQLDITKCLGLIFSGLLEMKTSPTLIKEIINEARHLFVKEEEQLIISAASHSMAYMESGEEGSYLERLQPDLAIAVVAIVEEARGVYE